MGKIIQAIIEPGKAFTKTEAQWEYNKGQELQISGVDLPEYFEAHFSNSINGSAKRVLGQNGMVTIPIEYFVSGAEIYCWIYVQEDESRTTRYQINIPVRHRAEPIDEQPDPDEQSVIDQAISALNSAVEQTAESALAAEGFAVGEQNGETVQPGSPYFENNSKFYSEQAQQAAAESGWVQFYIDENGDLHYVKTPNVAFSFFLQDGDLYVRA